jgi:hypothetical protein
MLKRTFHRVGVSPCILHSSTHTMLKGSTSVQLYNPSDIEGVRESFILSQLFPYCIRAAAMRLGHVHTQVRVELAQQKMCCQGRLNPGPRL